MPSVPRLAHASAARLSYLAIFAAAYVTGAVACLIQLSDIPITPRGWILSLADAFFTAMGVYLLDRVKLSARLLDPADALAHPLRHGYIERHQRKIRLAIPFLLAAGLTAGVFLSWLAGILTACACVGVLVYAGRPRADRPRVKDRLALKNTFVAAGITGFSLALMLLAGCTDGDRDWKSALAMLTRAIIPAVLLFFRVFADAALCDLDDEHADRAFGTSTLATDFGRTRAWNAALGIRLVLAIVIAVLGPAPISTRLVWGGITAISSLLVRFARPAKFRDWVDARLLIESLLAWAAIWYLE